jgi:hypothetical protein
MMKCRKGNFMFNSGKEFCMRISLISSILIGLALTGCSTINKTPPAPSHKLQYKNPITVSFYPEGIPNTPYTIIGDTFVSQYNKAGNKRQEATIHDAMRSKAALMGGDAIINIKRNDKTVTGTVIVYQPKIEV